MNVLVELAVVAIAVLTLGQLRIVPNHIGPKTEFAIKISIVLASMFFVQDLLEFVSTIATTLTNFAKDRPIAVTLLLVVPTIIVLMTFAYEKFRPNGSASFEGGHPAKPTRKERPIDLPRASVVWTILLVPILVVTSVLAGNYLIALIVFMIATIVTVYVWNRT